jgi:molybdopterin-binding protein
MKLSARDFTKGTVDSVIPGAVKPRVTLTIPGSSKIAPIITKSSADSLGLKKGTEAYAVIKASSVMIAVD